ncbi:hypothetical protein FA95DRAFT_1676944 [Auriscalpium vulgare]|uniref:Uncharacterized protein n=1 Tax=Auriscalpium vulgare TaxID=40419 RepID=A0ACB8S2Z5_9AGAM|nr:hypothetical protein FA95DRAFT_1676944 [Auriscalpium vulgare]
MPAFKGVWCMLHTRFAVQSTYISVSLSWPSALLPSRHQTSTPSSAVVVAARLQELLSALFSPPLTTSVGIGDIETLFKIGYIFYVAIDEVQGSTAQYQATKADIDQWSSFLKDAVEARQKIQRDVDLCCAMPDTVRNMTSKYDASLGSDQSKNAGKIRRLYLKLHWRVATKKKVAALEPQLSSRLKGLSMRIPLTLYRRVFLYSRSHVLLNGRLQSIPCGYSDSVGERSISSPVYV